MFLIAGLIGLAVSGVMMIAPIGAEEGEDDALPDGKDAPAETEAAPEGASPLTVAMGGPDGFDDTSPDARDLMPGEHVSDKIGGSQVQPILFRTDAEIGSAGNDDLAGSDRRDLILGGDGDDDISGGDGRDELQGGTGDDHLRGGRGDDILWGEDGADRIGGGNGADFLSGGDGADTLDGGAGDDRVFGGRGADVLRGGLGNDLLDGSVIAEGEDRDGTDRLDGGAGDDTLAAGAGDVLTGGDGADLYLFRAAPPALPDAGAADDDAARITDFDPDLDMIEIEYAEGEAAPDLSIARTEVGSELRLDGKLVAIVAGPAPVEAGHIALVAR